MTIFTLSTRTRLTVIAATLLASLVVINLQITAKQRIITEGTPILLELAPRDPRSLLQGDYMALRYAMADEVARAAQSAEVSDGQIVVELNDNGVARLVEIYAGEPLKSGRHLLNFRRRGESVRFASDAWFFEEGTRSQYRDARYGELRVSEDGEAVLTELRTGSPAAAGRAARRIKSTHAEASGSTASSRRDRRVARTRRRRMDPLRTAVGRV